MRKAIKPIPRRLCAGIILSRNHDTGKVVEGELIQCCHCQFTKLYTVGDELKWEYCSRCRNFRCPQKQCRLCVPIRQQNDNIREGKDQFHQKIIVSVSRSLPKGT